MMLRRGDTNTMSAKTTTLAVLIGMASTAGIYHEVKTEIDFQSWRSKNYDANPAVKRVFEIERYLRTVGGGPFASNVEINYSGPKLTDKRVAYDLMDPNSAEVKGYKELYKTFQDRVKEREVLLKNEETGSTVQRIKDGQDRGFIGGMLIVPYTIAFLSCAAYLRKGEKIDEVGNMNENNQG